MGRLAIFLLGLVGLANTQSASSASSQQVVTLSGSQRTLTRDYLPGVTLPSVFQGSTFASVQPSQPSNASVPAFSRATSTSSGRPVTNIGGVTRSLADTTTQTRPAQPSNTQPCNNYAEFCTRKYSNITEVAAHNSPFIRKNNVARNQNYGVTQQLNDGVRMIQGQAHYVNGTLYYCHTSCDLLNAGTVEDYLREVTAWVASHPFDVITIIFGNYNWADKDADGNALVTAVDYADPIEKSGLLKYIYQPPKTAMTVDDWPTLGEMILQQKRVVTFIDYNFDTNQVPYMLWQFYSIWETPFSPTDPDFPCTLGRPEGISLDQQKRMMYLANHNLNAEIAIGGLSLLVPNVAQIEQVNAVDGNASLGLMATQCTGIYDRPPNFLIVDFYDQGPTSGSVFEAAARANGVTYDRECCGTARSAASVVAQSSAMYLALTMALAAACLF